MSRPLYLGRRAGQAARLELDADQLVTHGVVLGMTGSGKTGLSVALLEELVGAGVPLIVLDPKGDMPNLGLVFPGLEPDRFQPWADDPEAAAEHHRQQLSHWDLGQEALSALASRLDLRIYTPGSSFGLGVDLLGCLDRSTVVSGLLGLLGVEADPVHSPEHVVLSQILQSSSEDMGLEALIVRLVDPPFKKVGVFPVDTFFPPEQRMKLAMRLNGLLASPSFADWTRGQRLDPDGWLESNDGRVPVSIFYLAHLSDAERMFFVSQLLERLLQWSRCQSGTNRLRALLYFDEAAGYLPPHPHDPASKQPLLTLMKQARAVGLGVLLATQNPVDLDYKALSNAGTWLIGSMQTAQDRERVADGLLSASAGFDRARLLSAFQGLGPRLFLLKSPGASEPVALQTRQTLSYLRGPMTGADLARLQAPPPAIPARPKLSGGAPPPPPRGYDSKYLDPGQLPDELEPFREPTGEDVRLRWRAALHAQLQLRFQQAQGGFVLDEVQHRLVFTPAQNSLVVPLEASALLDDPPPGGLFDPLPDGLDEARELKAAQAALIEEVFVQVTRAQWVHPGLKLYSAGDESRQAFQARCEQLVQQRIESQKARLRERCEKEMARLEERIQRHRGKIAQLESRAQGKETDQLLQAGQAILGLITRGKGRPLSSVLTKHQASAQARQKVSQASNELTVLHDRLFELREKLEREGEEIERQERASLDAIEARPVRLKRGDIRVMRFGVLWIPVTRPAQDSSRE